MWQDFVSHCQTQNQPNWTKILLFENLNLELSFGKIDIDKEIDNEYDCPELCHVVSWYKIKEFVQTFFGLESVAPGKIGSSILKMTKEQKQNFIKHGSEFLKAIIVQLTIRDPEKFIVKKNGKGLGYTDVLGKTLEILNINIGKEAKAIIDGLKVKYFFSLFHL